MGQRDSEEQSISNQRGWIFVEAERSVTVVSSAQVRTEKLCFVPWVVIRDIPGKPLEDNKNRSEIALGCV